ASLREASTIPELMGRYGFLATVLGYADTRRMFDASLADLGPKADALRGPGCAQDLDRLSTLAPRIVLGYHKLDEVGFSASFVLETSRGAAKALAKLPTSIPA